MLVCLAVKEMNELRFVLVPKFLSDEQFWAIYFALTRNRLPPEAFDVSLQQSEAPPPTEQPKVCGGQCADGLNPGMSLKQYFTAVRIHSNGCLQAVISHA